MVEKLIKDLVCGMRMRLEDAVHISAHEGVVYRFCSEACKRKFDQDPSRFVQRQDSGPAGPGRANGLPG